MTESEGFLKWISLTQSLCTFNHNEGGGSKQEIGSGPKQTKRFLRNRKMTLSMPIYDQHCLDKIKLAGTCGGHRRS